MKETQANLLCSVAKLIFAEKSGNWKVYVAYRPNNESDDELTKHNEATQLSRIDNVEFYLDDRLHYYNEKIGLYMDIACELLDEDGRLAGNMDWLHIGFNHDSMDLCIDHNDNLYRIANYSKESITEILPLLKSKCFREDELYAPFVC